MDDVRGDFLGPPRGTTPAAVLENLRILHYKNVLKRFQKIKLLVE